MSFLTPREIADWAPDPGPVGPVGSVGPALAAARDAMRRLGLDGPSQQMGRRWPVGCVALEITQRCNLDCTACYLSETAEAVRDLPLAEVYRRIDAIREHYGPGVDVQVTGGDPTLRPRDELIAIVARLASRGLRPTLMTNGIRASRRLLAELAHAGLSDVAFHVDTTQGRRGFPDERSLDGLRRRYLERARAAGLQVMFNTTVHDGNLGDVAHLARFFREHAVDVRTASFQIAADTGRGVLRSRRDGLDMEAVVERIERGAGTRIRFDATRVGHPRCSRYGLCLAAGGELHDLLRDGGRVARLQAATAGASLDRVRPLRSAPALARALLARPRALADGAAWAAGVAWRARRGLGRALLGRGRVSTLSFLVHAFMDADRLERDRVCACVFKVMTGEGPISMCLHNARRDDFVLAPVPVPGPGMAGARFWDPLTGVASVDVATPRRPDPGSLPRRRLKGRARARARDAGPAPHAARAPARAPYPRP